MGSVEGPHIFKVSIRRNLHYFHSYELPKLHVFENNEWSYLHGSENNKPP